MVPKCLPRHGTRPRRNSGLRSGRIGGDCRPAEEV